MTYSHHATLVRVDSVQAFELLQPSENSEIQELPITKFGIDDARELVKSAYNRPADAAERLFVVKTDFITLEAQNALLKVLEEPPLSTKFVFVIPLDLSILPTLASRFSEEAEEDGTEESARNEDFKLFLESSYKDRIAKIEQTAKQKDTEWQRSIKQGLIQYIKEAKNEARSLQKLEFTARLLLTRGASNKMLLEHVALILPTRS